MTRDFRIGSQDHLLPSAVPPSGLVIGYTLTSPLGTGITIYPAATYSPLTLSS